MAMGRRKRAVLRPMWVLNAELPRGLGHPCYQRLNANLAERDFDGFVEKLCSKFYARQVGRPSVPPAEYFRLLLVGYFEGLDSERGIAWRAADTLGAGVSWIGAERDSAGSSDDFANPAI